LPERTIGNTVEVVNSSLHLSLTEPHLSTDWAVTTRAIFGEAAATELWPDYAEWTDVVLASRATLRRKGRSFWLASAFLPARARDDLALVYAFCREVDDTVDECPDPVEAAVRLERLRAELLGQAPARPMVSAFRAATNRLRIPLGAALTLMDGVKSDLVPARIEDDDELLRYCYQVGATVGLMMCAVLGVRQSGWAHAVDLGVAMQLTNIVRDVAADARQGRVYLPAVRLRREGTTPEALLAGTADPEPVGRVLEALLDLADRYYRSGDQGMRDIPLVYRPAMLTASRVYQAIGLRARRVRHSPLRGRVVVPGYVKVGRVIQALAACLRPALLDIGPRGSHDRGLHRAFAGWPGSDA
jgi:phytoene synthase